MSRLIVRASTEADVVRCAEIYAHHVVHGTASFEVDPPDLAEMKRRRAAVLDLGLPHLVAERDARVLGYAYAGNWRPRPAYKFSVEDSIYIDKDAVGQGAGKALLPVLIEQCTQLGKRQMVAVIGDAAQTPSIRLHVSCGFEMVGTIKSIGFKFGRWLDSVLMQRPLGVGDNEPPVGTGLAWKPKRLGLVWRVNAHRPETRRPAVRDLPRRSPAGAYSRHWARRRGGVQSTLPERAAGAAGRVRFDES